MNLKNKDIQARLFYCAMPGLFFIIMFIILLCNPEFRSSIMYDSDTNWLLKTGEYIYQSGMQIPKVDYFSYTCNGKEWVLYQWLFEVLLYISYSIGSFEGVGILTTFAFTLTFTLIFIILLNENVNIVYVIISTTLGALSASVTYYARPSIITYVFIASLALIFYLAQKNKHGFLWILPLIFLVWANMHLGFMSGLVVLLVFFGYNVLKYSTDSTNERWSLIKKLLIIIILSFLATLITPYGLKLYTYMFTLGSSHYMNDNIKELISPNFHKQYYVAMLVSMLIIISLARFCRKINSFYLIVFALAIFSTLLFVRNIPYFGIFVALILGLQLQCLHDDILMNESVNNVLKIPVSILNKYNDFINYCRNITLEPSQKLKIPLSLVIIISFLILLIPFSDSSIMKKYFKFSYLYSNLRPLDAYKFVLKYKPPGRFYAESTWGSYAIFYLYPEYEVFVDTRFDMYGEKFFKLTHQLKIGSKSWSSVVKRYKINWIVVAPDSSIDNLINKSYSDEWFKIYEDKVAIIYMIKNNKNLEWYDKIKDKINTHEPIVIKKAAIRLI